MAEKKTAKAGEGLTAREGAFEVLEKIDQGAYANLALDQFLEGPGQELSRLDKSFLTEMVQGTVKYRLYLDWIIDSLLKNPGRLKPGPRNVLRLGLYQLCFLDRVPARAACFETVKLAKRKFHEGVGSLVNGVLRNWLRDSGQVVWPDEEKDPARYLSVRYSHPLWLTERWLERYGLEGARTFCEYNNGSPELWLRTNTLRVGREALMERLREQGCQVAAGRYAPEAVELVSGPPIRQLDTFAEGLVTVQDQSSMLVAHALRPEPGQRVLDVCAAPGGKTTHIAQLMKDQGQVLAWDVHPHRVALIAENARRLGVGCVSPQPHDAAARPSPEEMAVFDRVLVDAPCSGLGVLRRRADARWRRRPEEIQEITKLQRQILSGALERLAPGGRLIYSTCTVEPEENALLVNSVLAEKEKEEPGRFAAASLGLEALGLAAGSQLQCLPFYHQLEGFFLAAIERSL